MRALAEKPDHPAAHVQPRAHPIPFFRRWRDLNGSGQGDPADASEGVGDHKRLQFELTRIDDVRVQTAAAEESASRAAIARRLLDIDRRCVGHALRHALDLRAHPFARNRAGDQHHQAVRARNHPAARRGFVDRERDDVTG